jgi:hypothetical protein
MRCNLRRVVGIHRFLLGERRVGRGSALSHREAINYAQCRMRPVCTLIHLDLALCAGPQSSSAASAISACPAFCTRYAHASYGIRPGLYHVSVMPSEEGLLVLEQTMQCALCTSLSQDDCWVMRTESTVPCSPRLCVRIKPASS